MMDHRSSKVCAAAAPACKHSHAGTVAITILKERRMIASQKNDQMKQLKVMRLRSLHGRVPVRKNNEYFRNYDAGRFFWPTSISICTLKNNMLHRRIDR